MSSGAIGLSARLLQPKCDSRQSSLRPPRPPSQSFHRPFPQEREGTPAELPPILREKHLLCRNSGVFFLCEATIQTCTFGRSRNPSIIVSVINPIERQICRFVQYPVHVLCVMSRYISQKAHPQREAQTVR